MEINGAAAVVTGGASGIGRAIAEELIRRKCKVAIADFDGERAKTLAKELGANAIGVRCDVSDHQSVEALRTQAEEAFGPLDLVFANAGVMPNGPLLHATPEQFDWVFGINVRGAWSTATVFARRMRETGRNGWICITSSEHALGLQHLNAGIYTASKQAVLGMAEVLQGELPKHIGVSGLCPGLTATELAQPKEFSPLPRKKEGEIAFGNAVMARGMSPATVARAAVSGVERGDFLIVTHSTSFPPAKARYDRIVEAFAKPLSEDAGNYDVQRTIAEVAAERGMSQR